MSLRAKCALLLLAFEITLGATILLTVRYIRVYFDDAAGLLTRSSAGIAGVSRLRTLVRDDLTHLLQDAPHPSMVDESRGRRERIAAATVALERDPGAQLSAEAVARLESLSDARTAETERFLQDIRQGRPEAPPLDPEPHLALDQFLGEMESTMLDEMRFAVDASFKTQEKAALILSINMLVGAGLGILGIVLVRRWVLSPIQELERATDELGKGNLEHRARVTSCDELGRLARAVNRMSADLARIERQMVQRERFAAMGELITYITHNIRNPLAGIRSLAEACRRESKPGSPIAGHHDRIVSSIDKFEQWLRELEQTCKPLEMEPRPVHLRRLVDNVVTVFRPMSDRRSIRVSADGLDRRLVVSLDARHFEQALAAVVGNAIEAAGDRGRVTIGMESNGDSRQWKLTVADTGPGIPPEIRERVFEPSFTTKRNGHGLGLSMAKKVIELHGGQLAVACPPEGGTVFSFVMHQEVGSESTHG
ncbi:MAG: ATP-binding protein [Phycisphaerae bacterium]